MMSSLQVHRELWPNLAQTSPQLAERKPICSKPIERACDATPNLVDSAPNWSELAQVWWEPPQTSPKPPKGRSSPPRGRSKQPQFGASAPRTGSEPPRARPKDESRCRHKFRPRQYRHLRLPDGWRSFGHLLGGVRPADRLIPGLARRHEAMGSKMSCRFASLLPLCASVVSEVRMGSIALLAFVLSCDRGFVLPANRRRRLGPRLTAIPSCLFPNVLFLSALP